VLEDVDVERLVGALAQRPLHLHVLVVEGRGPLGVDGARRALVGELDAVRAVGLVENAELGGQGGVLGVFLAG
jgi:hypothetical protein